MVLREIIIKGAREHNLKDIGLRLPRNSLITITGVSGSGKSSLAYDTIYREGQRRFVESLSTYARQFMGRMDKPRVDYIEGLSPTVSIDQKSVNRNPRSTVGTITEIYDHFRLLFARLGQPHCPECGHEVSALGPDRIVDRIMELPKGTPIQILAPVVRDRKGEYRKDLEGWRLKGYVRARIDGHEVRLEEQIRLERYKKHTIELVLDRVKVAPDRRGRIADTVEMALSLTGSLVSVLVGEESRTYSAKLSCPNCDVDIPELEPRLFSFNSPQGACPHCDGLGTSRTVDPELIVPDPSLSINAGAIRTMTRTGYLAYSRLGPESLAQVAAHFGFSLDQPWSSLSAKQKKILLYGSGDQKVHLAFEWQSASSSMRVKGEDHKPIEGIIPTMEKAYRASRPRHLERFMCMATCPECLGARLRAEALSVTFRDLTIHDFTSLTIGEARSFFDSLRGARGAGLEGREAAIGHDLLAEIVARLSFLEGVGLEYLTLDRPAATLSGGESQRVRLATQLGAGLQGVLYVLDEPTIGLHPRDNRRLIGALEGLRERGNTVIVVEHDRDMMLASDHLVDMGPGAGRFGGEVVGAGTPEELSRPRGDTTQRGPRKRKQEGKAPSKGAGKDRSSSAGISTTGRYLAEEAVIPVPVMRRPPNAKRLTLRGARCNNLKKLNVSIPVGLLTVVTGVSGSGKSSLVTETLVPALRHVLGGGHGHGDGVMKSSRANGHYTSLAGAHHFDRVVEIDQSPIGRTPRSNPATYTKVFGLIRDVFAGSVEARLRGYDKGRFSFNKKGGRCETCGGSGVLEMEMHFLPNVVIPCDDCSGRRYNRETLEILYRGLSINDVLDMTVRQALEFFAAHTKIVRILETLRDVGLGYITLGQPSTTISGGEAQRVKLAAELCRPTTGRSFYVLDEPTTGLHFEDILKLLETLQLLVDGGNTMVIVEHNLDVIKVADHLIDLGPEGGDEGGELVAEGTPEEVAGEPESLTGIALAPVLGLPVPKARGKRRAAVESFGGMRPGSQAPKPDRGTVLTAVNLEEQSAIRVEGARIHNLQNLDVSIPHNKLTVITGISGSGKTSLAFDTIFAEGQRRFVESLSTYARRFIARLDRVPVDRIDGLAPAIAIDQRSASRNPRSTVATSTEIHDYLRVLFARVGLPHCPSCGVPVRAYSPGLAAADAIARLPGEKVLVTAPLYRRGLERDIALAAPEKLEGLVPELVKKGFLRLCLDESTGSDSKGDSGPAQAGVPKMIRFDSGLDGYDPQMIEGIDLVIDRLNLKDGAVGRLADSLEQAYQEGHGMALVRRAEGNANGNGGGDIFYSQIPGCLDCGRFVEDLSPRMFSFNSHVGACPSCDGLGQIERCDPNRLIKDKSKPLLRGAMPGKVGQWLSRSSGVTTAAVRAVGRLFGFDPDLPWTEVPPAGQRAILSGEGIPEQTLALTMNRTNARRKREYTFETEWFGILPVVEDWYRSVRPRSWRRYALAAVMDRMTCLDCGGSRLRPVSLAVTVGAKNIEQICALSIEEALEFFETLELDEAAEIVAHDALQEVGNRLRFLRDVGLGYLTLNRTSSTLSGGEAQRIRLASQLGNRLVGVIYVLDEPTIGLHQRDVDRLLKTLFELRDLGNTVVVVEHDRETISAADHVIDIGPGAGRLGGQVVAAGRPGDLVDCPESVTGRYLAGSGLDSRREVRRAGSGRALRLVGATRHNLKKIDVTVPLGCFVAVTGVSGSGKSTLVMELLQEALKESLESRATARRDARSSKSGASKAAGQARDLDQMRSSGVSGLDALEGSKAVDKQIVIDQEPIGRSSVSNPATYTKLFDPIRDIFAATPEARMRGFGKCRFSFNAGDGRCPACDGRGVEIVEMHFLSDVTITCEVCRGQRYNRETLEVTYKGKTISDILEMDVNEAAEFFKNHRRISKILGTLTQVGLGYIRLGQPSNTLSGGEAQRLKLAAELCRPNTGKTVYLLDEPTTGLHFEDTRGLMEVLHKLVDLGNTVVVVEHNLDVIAGADHVLDLGPEGGDAGGECIAAGTPEQMVFIKRSHTGQHLARYLIEQDLEQGVHTS